MKKILAIGTATLDIINTVSHYPQEDEEMRADAQRMVTGGNANNTLKVLVQHGHEVEFVGTLADDSEGKYIAQQMRNNGIGLHYLHWLRAVKSPVSYITVNAQTGSRTIIHYRNLPELKADYFATIPAVDFDWLHVEGRNVYELAKMLASCHDFPLEAISLEIEKRRDDIEELIPYAGTIMFSKAYMQSCGFDDAKYFLLEKARAYPGKAMTCAVGEQGAYGVDREGVLYFVAAKCVEVVDSIGAGDSFNAGLIHSLCTGRGFHESVRYATSLASRKVAQFGFSGLC